ncbi:hypothetical protein QYE76_004989 [Lolium multiflorum]|uniref:Uncharacterized protein n=1 Tax=Lolium multiflorum TaxID=4521 RepID=A0AAD8RTV7_LOLMU|nr:hypothetical protein QYE76_004989 [Lolium multiflorum]
MSILSDRRLVDYTVGSRIVGDSADRDTAVLGTCCVTRRQIESTPRRTGTLLPLLGMLLRAIAGRHGWAYRIRGPAGRHAQPQRPCWPTRSHAAAGPAGRCLPPPRSLANHASTCTHLPPDGRHPRMRRRSAGSRPRVPAAAPRAPAAAPLVAGARRPPPLRCYARRRRGPAGRHPPPLRYRAQHRGPAGQQRPPRSRPRWPRMPAPSPRWPPALRPRPPAREPSARSHRPRAASERTWPNRAKGMGMTGIMNREFAELPQNGLNYLTWASDVEIVLEGKEMKGALSAGTPMAPSTTTPAQNAQALHFLRHHMCGTLKNEYMAERSASALWAADVYGCFYSCRQCWASKSRGF